jgi:hypothetical protein
VSYLDQVLGLAEELGGQVKAPLADVVTFRARAAQLGEDLRQLRAADERLRARVVGELIDGRIATGGLLDNRQALGYWDHDSPASRAVGHAIAGCHAKVDAAAVAAAPAVFAELQDLVAGVVAESVKLTASLPPEVNDERQAFTESRGGAHHFAAWMRLEQVADRWILAHRLARVMRTAGWIPGPGHGGKSENRPTVYTMFRHPNRLPNGWNTQPEPLKIGCAAAGGAGPGLYSWDDAREWLAARDRQTGRVEDTPMTQVTVWPSRAAAALNLPVVEASAQQAVPTGPPRF